MFKAFGRQILYNRKEFILVFQMFLSPKIVRSLLVCSVNSALEIKRNRKNVKKKESENRKLILAIKRIKRR